MNKHKPSMYNEPKIRNTLKLAERVEVIREYDTHGKRPTMKKLAEQFSCSIDQIRNILDNRKSILESCRKGNAASQKLIYSPDDSLQKRQEKIDLLGKVMYEYLQRMLYFSQTIDYHKFRLKALQIKDCISVENFQLTDDWIDDFKMTYNIQGFDSQSLRNNIVITEAKRPLLSAIDMIQYVNRKIMEESSPKADINVNECLNSPKSFSNVEPKIIYEIEDEEQDDEYQKLKFSDSPIKSPPALDSFSTNASKYAVKRRATSPLPDIESVDEALKHVKALEEYAMLHDNFRAIGLLTQLEQIFKNPGAEE